MREVEESSGTTAMSAVLQRWWLREASACRFANHEKSKKHKENVQFLKEAMQEEEAQFAGTAAQSEEVKGRDAESQDATAEGQDAGDSVETKPPKTKHKKKSRK
ncbi:hypothetical protein HPB51_003667 [Rhipicephalus microplus]|uniref:Uncharacterized protein n=1 Tax=Rhipicephalus microplus TaxID=6941 RepID=A0A9J6ELG1_RHIMP|nr:hypothetical protein HPB51_003667 [Rhipicephalus microplus]